MQPVEILKVTSPTMQSGKIILIINYTFKIMETPLHKHDCEECNFLGTYEGTKDLYVCHKQSSRPTVICRYSSDGPDYSSGIDFIFSNTDLTVAAFRAINAKLIDPELVYKVILKDLTYWREEFERKYANKN
jgi:hypothetical protein